MALPQGKYGIQLDAADRPMRRVWVVLGVLALAAALAWAAYGAGGCRRMMARKQQPAQPPPGSLAPLPAGRADGATGRELQRLIASADARARDDDLAGARADLLAALARAPQGALRDRIELRLGEIGIELVCSRRPMPGKTDYVIRPGDATQLIARRFGITQELVIRANGIADPNRIVSGRRLRILEWPAFRIVVNRRGNSLLLTLNGEFFKRYAVGIGRSVETAPGTYVIQRKIERPSWWLADGREVPYGAPENVVGTRWLSLAATGTTTGPARRYGIHGTWNASGIGRASGQGCIRMRNADIEELFMLVSEGTPVIIGDY